MKRVSFLLFALAAWAAAGRAESPADAPAPQPPYVAPVPAWGHWMVTFKYAAPPAAGDAKPPEAPGGFPLSVETVRSGPTGTTTVTYAEGAAKVFSQQGGWTATAGPQGPQLVVISPQQAPYPFYSAGFVILDGMTIGPKSFKEAAKRNGVPCFHYADKDCEAWIAADTMLPVAARNGEGVQAEFQFQAPPTKPVVLPADQADLLRRGQAAYDSVRTLR